MKARRWAALAAVVVVLLVPASASAAVRDVTADHYIEVSPREVEGGKTVALEGRAHPSERVWLRFWRDSEGVRCYPVFRTRPDGSFRLLFAPSRSWRPGVYDVLGYPACDTRGPLMTAPFELVGRGGERPSVPEPPPECAILEGPVEVAGQVERGALLVVPVPADERAGPATFIAKLDGERWVPLVGLVREDEFAGALCECTRIPGPGTYALVFAENFKDVYRGGHWAFEVASCARMMGAMSGYPDGTFRPDRPLTRAEFVSALVRSRRLPETSSGEAFSDVDPKAWYAGAAGAARSLGWVQGSGGKLEPERPVTRAEACAVLGRALGVSGPHAGLQFADAGAVPGWALDAVAYLAEKGAVSGYPDGSFRPSGTLTRAEFAALVYRLTCIEAGIEPPARVADPWST